MLSRFAFARRTTGLVLALVMVATLVNPARAQAGFGPEDIGRKPSIPSQGVETKAVPPDPEGGTTEAWDQPIWPTAGTADVSLSPGQRAGATPGWTQAGNLPVYVAPAPADAGVPRSSSEKPSRVRVEVLGSDAAGRLGGHGLAVRLHSLDKAAKPGPVSVTLDYSGFRNAYGGDFAGRLKLVRLPECALASPTPASCRTHGEPVRINNDLRGGRIGATVQVPPEGQSGDVLLLKSSVAGESGSYAATDVKASGKWDVGLASGAFTYSYGFQLPPPPYGSAPSLGLAYNSQSVDGRTSAENNQASTAGLGWDLQTGSIERRFKSCAEDANNDVMKTWGDLCWDSPYKDKDDGAVYVISLNGQTTELLWDGHHYRMKDDQNWRIEHPTTGGQGADSEYWIITTPDGTRYYLGYGADPTRTSGNATNSVWTVPVIGDDAGEPCHNSSDPAQMTPCQQAYRWKLDRIVDSDENETIFTYATESNAYKRVQGAKTLSYTRGGYLSRVEYGKRSDQPKDTPAPNVVEFSYLARCVEATNQPDPYSTQPPNCPAATPANAGSYKDVPVDKICSANCTETTPSFFITQRLHRVVTKTRKVDGSSGYDDVNTYQLKMAFPDTGDADTSGALWLDYVRRIGHMGDGPDVRLPPVTFDGTLLANRADAGGGLLKMRRIARVQNDLGGATSVTYGQPHKCNTGLTDWSGEKNANDCFQQYYTPDGQNTGKWGVFNKYLVTQVTNTDRVGGQVDQKTSYEYLGGAGWRFDDDLSHKTDYQSWSDFRGHAGVRVTKGSSTDRTQLSISTYEFFRGLHNDRTKRDGSGTNRTVTLTDFDGKVWDDHHFMTGRPLQTRVWQEAAGGTRTDVTSTRHTYWSSPKTADGPGFHNAYMIRPDSTVMRARKADGTYQVAQTDTVFDSEGRPVKALDKGDPKDSGDDRCASTTYADNTDGGRWMLAFPETATLHEGSCEGPAAGRSVTLYDGAAEPGAGNKPFDGNPTSVRIYKDANTYGAGSVTYDRFGRVTSTTEPNGTPATNDDTSTIAYTPAEGWPTGGITTTTPAPLPGGQPHVSKVFPGRADGAPSKTLDANNNVTSLDYDPANRLIRVWGPTEPKPTNPSEAKPTVQYSYWTPQEGINPPSGATVVKTERLQSGSTSNPNWLETWGYLDGFGRQVETQTRTPAGSETGRMTSITRYDDRGLVAGTTGTPVYNADGPGRGLANTHWTAIPSWTTAAYDGAGRLTTASLYGSGTKKWSSTIAPAADITVATPPSGGKRATLSDVRGRPTTLIEDYQGQAPSTTRFGYGVHDELVSITDAEGNITRQHYDWTGQRTSSDDPDTGHSAYTYDDAGNLVSTVDATGTKVSLTYDALNRPIGQWAGEPETGTRLAQWEYDPQGFKGLPAAATRWTNGQPYRTETLGYDDRYRPVGKRITVPASEGALAGKYEYRYAYDKADHLTELTMPAAGGLPAETLTATYSPLTGTARTLTSDLGGEYTYVKRNYYWSTGEIAQRDYGKLGGIARSYDFDDPTGRLTRIRAVTGNDTGQRTPLQDDTYTYTPAGLVSQITESLTESPDGSQGPQRQCFTYDGTNRLAQAWTTTSTAALNCNGGIDGADGRGPDPYKLAYEYTDSGNISTVTDNGAKRSYTYPAPGPNAVRPHSVTKISGSAGTDTYGYDDVGRLKTRTVAGKATTLDWDKTQRLVQASTGGTKTGMVYNADGSRLIRRDGATSTLYLDGMEVRATGASVSATRYYTFDGATVALRKNGDPAATWMMGDAQGSAQMTVEGWSGNVARQRYLPFGAHRGRDEITATERGFLGRTEDPTTDLVALDNRYYDATIGRFISPDPLANPGSPQSLNPYSYAQNNPTSDSDPSGLCSPMAGCATNPGLANAAGGGPAYQTDPGLCTARASMTGLNECEGPGILNRPPQFVAPPGPPPVSWKKALGPMLDDVLEIMGYTPGMDTIGDVGSAIRFGIKGEYRQAAITIAMVLIPIPGGGPVARKILKALEDAPHSKPRVTGNGGSGKPDGPNVQQKAAGSPGKKPKGGGERNAPAGAPRGGTHGCGGGDNSFVPQTEVVMADGSRKPISKVKVGDKVLATDPKTGETHAQPVTAVITGKGAKNLVQITADTDGPAGHKTGVVIATDNHPFWVGDQQRWMNAGELKPGMWLRTSAGTHIQITAIRAWTQQQRVRNLTVKDDHTYYVLAGNTPALVHNADPGCADKLRKALNDAGDLEPATPHSPHHIVAGNSSKAAPARSVLDRFGIGVNDAENGVWLPRSSASPNPNGLSVHSRIHTNEYYDYVNYLMDGARTRGEALDVIDHVRRQLLGGFWP